MPCSHVLVTNGTWSLCLRTANVRCTTGRRTETATVAGSLRISDQVREAGGSDKALNDKDGPSNSVFSTLGCQPRCAAAKPLPERRIGAAPAAG